MCRDLDISFKKEPTPYGHEKVAVRRKEVRAWRRKPAAGTRLG